MLKGRAIEKENRIRVNFDLEMPWKPQMKMAQERFKIYQSALVLDSKNIYKFSALSRDEAGYNILIQHLRIIDARRKKVPFSKIADVIMPDRDEGTSNIQKLHKTAQKYINYVYPMIAFIPDKFPTTEV